MAVTVPLGMYHPLEVEDGTCAIGPSVLGPSPRFFREARRWVFAWARACTLCGRVRV